MIDGVMTDQEFREAEYTYAMGPYFQEIEAITQPCRNKGHIPKYYLRKRYEQVTYCDKCKWWHVTDPSD